MLSKFITREGKDSLLLIFAGWGMDWRPFAGLRHDAYDIAVAWDYRVLDGEALRIAEPYKEVCVVAWSLGVYAAAKLEDSLPASVTRRIAVNGTLTPVHDERGIPEAIFDGTLANLSERNLQKFNMRMCGGRDGYERFMQSAPERGLEELIDELATLGADAKEHQEAMQDRRQAWDLAIVCKRDAIFPAANQARAWAGGPVVELDQPHLPDFQQIIDKYLINKPLVRQRFSGAADTYGQNAAVQTLIAYGLWSQAKKRLPGGRLTGKILEIGSGPGLLTAIYAGSVDADADWRLWDIVDQAPEGCVGAFECCDAEMAIRREPSASLDCVLSNCTVQWFSSPGRFLGECARVLKPGGLLALTTFAPDNLPELAAGTLAAPTADEWKSMVSPLFEKAEISSHEHKLVFDTPLEALRHIKATGVNAVRQSTAAEARALIANYPLDSEGKAQLTYRSITMILTR